MLYQYPVFNQWFGTQRPWPLTAFNSDNLNGLSYLLNFGYCIFYSIVNLNRWINRTSTTVIFFIFRQVKSQRFFNFIWRRNGFRLGNAYGASCGEIQRMFNRRFSQRVSQWNDYYKLLLIQSDETPSHALTMDYGFKFLNSCLRFAKLSPCLSNFYYFNEFFDNEYLILLYTFFCLEPELHDQRHEIRY